MLCLSLEELVFGSVHLVLSGLPQGRGGFYKAACVTNGGVSSGFRSLRLKEVLSNAVCRSWKQKLESVRKSTLMTLHILTLDLTSGLTSDVRVFDKLDLVQHLLDGSFQFLSVVSHSI